MSDITNVQKITGCIAPTQTITANIAGISSNNSSQSDHRNTSLVCAADISETTSKLYDVIYTKYDNILTTDNQNISNWSKNMDSFPQLDNDYSDGVNNITYEGGSGYERIYLAVNTEVNSTYCFEFDFKTSTGFTCSYGSTDAYAFVSSSTPNEDALLSMSSVIAKTVLDSTASEDVAHYVVKFRAQSDTTYLGIDMGYMVDGVVTNLCFSNINLYPADVKYESEESV